MSKKCILIVEDDPIISSHIQQLLQHFGYEANHITEGEQALAKAEEIGADLILMDINLAGEIDGITAATEIQEKLDRVSEAKREALLNAFPDLMFTIERNGQIIDYQAKDDLNLLRPQDSVIGSNIHEVLPPALAKQTQQMINQASEVGNLQTFDYKVEVPAGLRYFEVRIVPINEQEVFCIIRDITSRKQQEKRMRQLSNAVESTADSIIITDIEGKIEYVNPAFEAVTGYSQAEAVGQTPNILRSGEHAPSFYEHLWQTVLAGQTFRAVFTNRHKNGSLYYEDRTIAPLLDEEGEVTHFVSTGRDITERRLAQWALRESERNYRILMNQAADGILILDEAGRIIEANTQAVILLGYQPERLKKKLFNQLMLVEQTTTSFLSGAQQLNSGQNIVYEQMLAHQSGHFIPVEINIKKLSDGRLQAILRDISQRKQLERRLDAIYKLGQELVLVHEEPTIIHKALSTAVEILEANAATFGFVNQEEQTLTFRYCLVNNRLQRIEEVFPLHKRAGLAVQAVLENKQKNFPDTQQEPTYTSPQGRFSRSEIYTPLQIGGSTRAVLGVEAQTYNQFSASDERVLQTLVDQTAVALENSRLYRAEQSYRQEIEAVQRASLSLTSSLELSDVLEQIVHSMIQLVAGQNAHIFLWEKESLVFGSAIVAGQISQTPYFEPRPEGLTYLVAQQGDMVVIPDMSTHPLFAHLEEPIEGAIVAIPLKIRERTVGVMDVSRPQNGTFTASQIQALKLLAAQAAIAIENARLFEAEQAQMKLLQKSQAQLIQAEKMGAVGRLSASVAHEINNPLQAVQTCVTLTQEELAGEQKKQTLERYLNIIETEIARVSKIVQRMRDFYRPASKEFEAVSLNQLLEDILILSGKQLEHKEIAVDFQPWSGLPTIEANPSHLKQVFLNLVLNGMDAMPQGGRLTITTSLDTISLMTDKQNEQEAIRVEITDEGIGMTTETMQQLFEPFFTTKEDGAGLGLAISFGIIESHGGTILCESSPGEGTTFTVLLPLEQRVE